MASSIPAKHHRAEYFLNQGLFDGLTSFADLEARISVLPPPPSKDRGDAFEFFAEAYLATQKTAQAQEIWPEDTVPLSVLRRLALPERDMGADGVYQTTLGEYCAYQVKFRSGRPSLTWKELSTFMGLTEKVSERVLFTNCDGLPKIMDERDGFFCIRGSDLDALRQR